jgi:hypothetical protein
MMFDLLNTLTMQRLNVRSTNVKECTEGNYQSKMAAISADFFHR